MPTERRTRPRPRRHGPAAKLATDVLVPPISLVMNVDYVLLTNDGVMLAARSVEHEWRPWGWPEVIPSRRVELVLLMGAHDSAEAARVRRAQRALYYQNRGEDPPEVAAERERAGREQSRQAELAELSEMARRADAAVEHRKREAAGRIGRATSVTGTTQSARAGFVRKTAAT